MALNTGINSLNAGAPDLRLSGDIETVQAIPIELQKIILQYWIQQGDGSTADRIEDVPKEFRDRIIQLFRQRASAPERSMSAYGGTARPTYTQSRKQRMAGGGIMGSNAGSMLVAPTADGSRPGYGWLGDAWDWGKEKVGKLIPNELKNPAALATIAGLGPPVIKSFVYL